MPFGTDMEEVKHESAEPAFPMQSPAPCKRQQKQLEKQIKKEKKEKKAAFRLGLTWAKVIKDIDAIFDFHTVFFKDVLPRA